MQTLTKNPLLKKWKTCLASSLLCMTACTAKGPSFPNAPPAEPPPLAGHYRFALSRDFYYKNLLGELYLERARSRKAKLRFYMRSLGQNHQDAIRVHSYEGLAYNLGKGIMELRSERCYLFGKRDWEGRMSPLARWDCDHLFFAFHSPSQFRRREILKPMRTERTKYSDWSNPTDLVPLPLGSKSLSKQAYFAGQIIHLDESPKSGLVLVWGNSGGSLLRDGQILQAQNEQAKSVGKLRVLSRPGDFIVCRWIGKAQSQATVAYTYESFFGAQASSF